MNARWENARSCMSYAGLMILIAVIFMSPMFLFEIGNGGDPAFWSNPSYHFYSDGVEGNAQCVYIDVERTDYVSNKYHSSTLVESGSQLYRVDGFHVIKSGKYIVVTDAYEMRRMIVAKVQECPSAEDLKPSNNYDWSGAALAVAIIILFIAFVGYFGYHEINQ